MSDDTALFLGRARQYASMAIIVAVNDMRVASAHGAQMDMQEAYSFFQAFLDEHEPRGQSREAAEVFGDRAIEAINQFVSLDAMPHDQMAVTFQRHAQNIKLLLEGFSFESVKEAHAPRKIADFIQTPEGPSLPGQG